MANDDQVEKPVPLSLLLIFMVFVMASFMFFVLPSMEDLDPYRPLATEKDIDISEAMSMGKQNLEHEGLIAKARKDFKIPQGLEVKIFVGPYAHISIEGVFVHSTNPFIIVLLLDEALYQELSPNEKIALVGHELGHLGNKAVVFPYNPYDTIIEFQIEADTYATKYASPEAMIAVLNKTNARHGNPPSREHNLRIQNLERIIKAKQGH